MDTSSNNSSQNHKYIDGIVLLDIHSLKKVHTEGELLEIENLKRVIGKSFKILQTGAQKLLGASKFPLIPRERFEFLEINKRYDDQQQLYYVYFELCITLPDNTSQTFLIDDNQNQSDFTNTELQNYILYESRFKEFGEISTVVFFWNKIDSAFQKKLHEEHKEGILINYEQFQNQYLQLMRIDQEGQNQVYLYYDLVKKRVYIVKQFQEIYVQEPELSTNLENHSTNNGQEAEEKEKEDDIHHINNIEDLNQVPTPIQLCPQEIKSIHNIFSDKSIDNSVSYELLDSQNLNKRNIARQIEHMLSLSNSSDKRSRYIEKLEGVVLKQIQGQEEGQEYTTIMVINEFFGGLDCQQNHLSCDLYSYFTKNYDSMFDSMYLTHKKKLIQSIFTQILDGLSLLHEQNIMVLDIKDDSLIIRRKYDHNKENKCNYEIQFIDYGFCSYQQQNKIPDMQIDYKLGPFIHPRYIYKQEKYQLKDDIYALGIFFIKFSHQHLFVTEDQVSKHMKVLIEHLTGFQYDDIIQYFNMINRISFLRNEISEKLQLQFKQMQHVSQQTLDSGSGSTSDNGGAQGAQSTTSNKQETEESIAQKIADDKEEIKKIQEDIQYLLPPFKVEKAYKSIPSIQNINKTLFENLTQKDDICSIF